LPHERVKLYDKCVTALMDTWDEVKGLPIAEKKRPFYRYRRRLLERLAHDLHTQPEKPGKLQTVKEGDMKSLLTRFLMQKQQLKFANDPDGAQEEARAFVRLARGRTGLLVERGEGIFGFPHLTFQEYLAACDIEKRSMPYGVDAVWKEIKDRLHDPHWREVILLLLGSLNRYEDAPTILVERVLETGKEDKFEPVLHRHLYLAARALADRVDVADDLRRRVVTTMLKIAGKAHPWEQIATISELSWLKGDNYAVDGLLALAQDQKIDYEVRIDAASALGQMGHAVEADEILFALIRDEMKTYAIAAHVFFNLFVRGHVGERVQEGLLALAQNETMDYQVRFTAILNAGELRHIGEKLRDGLLTLARDEKADNSLRRQAASALGHSGSSEEKVLDALLALVKDTKVKDWVRSAAASALGHSGSSEEKVLDALLALAKDTKVKEGVRSEAASALGKLGSSEEKVLDVLLALAKDTKVKYGVRIAAYRTLQSLVDIIK